MRHQRAYNQDAQNQKQKKNSFTDHIIYMIKSHVIFWKIKYKFKIKAQVTRFSFN